MADDFVDPFADIDLNAEPEGARPEFTPRNTPLTVQERLIIQNLFDTQPKRRAAYLNKLGFEMNPENPNQYRPLGSNLEFTAEIDPGVSFYFQKGALGKKFKDIAAEAGKDALDLLGDVASGIVTAGAAKAGATIGSAAGAAASVPTTGGAGLPVALILGGITGGALGAGAAEMTKEELGNMLLDENVPADKGLMGVQAVITGLAPVALKAGASGLKKAYAGMLSLRTNAIKNAAKSAGGGITDELLNKAAQKPEMFTKEAVEGANARLTTEYKKLFGINPDTPITPKSTRQIAPDSVFGKAVNPLNRQADEELSRLAKMPEANWKASEILGPINSRIDQLASKFSRSSEENAALMYLRSKKAFIENKAKNKIRPKLAKEFATEKAKQDAAQKAAQEANARASSFMLAGGAPPKIPTPVKIEPKEITEDMIMNVEFDFRQGREFLKTLQDDAFNRELPGSSILAQYAGGLRQAADAKAGDVGSSLPEINAKRSQILSLFEQAKTNITPQKLTSAFIGNDTIAKEQTRQTLMNMDQLLGTNVSEAVETGALQRVMENAYSTPVTTGSSRVMGSMLSEGLAGAAKGGGVGFAIGAPVGAGKFTAGLGAVAGGIQGAKRGALMARPEVAIPALAEAAARERAVNAAIARPLSQTAQTIGTAATSAVQAKTGTGGSSYSEMEEEDPFADINFE